MKQKSPELDIPEGVFYSEIKDYNLKVAKKNRKTGMLYDVLIYSMKDGFEKARIIYADSGRLEMTADKQHLWLHLYSGDLFENLKAQSMKSENVPYRREEFREKHTIIEFNSISIWLTVRLWVSSPVLRIWHSCRVPLTR
jgi:lipopolysaccharide export system permease protein